MNTLRSTPLQNNPEEVYGQTMKTKLWGLSSWREPLRSDVFKDFLQQSSLRPDLHGMRNSVPSAHETIEKRGFVQDEGAIPLEDPLPEHVPCGLLHPGLCPEKTRPELYTQCLSFAHAFVKMVAKEGSVGDCLHLRMHPSSATCTVFLAHIRYANPKQAVLFRALRQDGKVIVSTSTSRGGRPMVSVVLVPEIALELLSSGAGPGCSVRKLGLKPSLHRLGEFIEESEGEETELDFPDQKPDKRKKKHKKNEVDRAFDFAFGQVLPPEPARPSGPSDRGQRAATPVGVAFRGALRADLVEYSGSDQDSDSDLELIKVQFREHKKSVKQSGKRKERGRGQEGRSRAKKRRVEHTEDEEEQRASVDVPLILPAQSSASSSQPMVAPPPGQVLGSRS